MIGLKKNNIYNQQCHIIGIGIDDYKYKYKGSKGWTKLYNCELDIERFIKKVCNSFETFEDSPHYVTRLYNGNATSDLIRTTILGKTRNLTSKENLIIYFAGHGVNYEKTAYLAPQDAQTDYVEPEKSKLISFKNLYDWIDNTGSWHIVLILDCCHGGRIMDEKRSSTPSLEDLLDENIGTIDYEGMSKKKSVWVITSGSDNERVSDGGDKGSPFSEILMKILESSIRSNLPIPISQVGFTLKSRFPKRFKQRPNFHHLSDIKGLKNTGGEFIFYPKQNDDTSEQTNFIESNEANNTPSISEPIQLINEAVDEAEIYQPPLVDIHSIGDLYPVGNQDIEDIEYDDYEYYPDKKIKSDTRKQANSLLYGFLLLILVVMLGVWVLNSSKDFTERPQNEEFETNQPSGAAISKEILDTYDPKQDPNLIAVVVPKPYHHVKRRRVVNADFQSDTSKKADIVFAGSFENKDNALNILAQLKKIGYQNAEIVMKENLPYMIVVTGFNMQKKEAKREVQSLQKKGIEAYHSERQADKVYRSEK